MPSHDAPTGDVAAIERLLGGAATEWLMVRVRARIVAAAGGPLHGVVRLQHPSPDQRKAVMALVGAGARRGGAGVSVDLAVLEQMLRRGPWPSGLADAVQTLTGPVTDQRAERERDTSAWVSAHALLTPAYGRFPQLSDWWDQWCAAGGLKRAARSESARLSRPFGPDVGTALMVDLLSVLDRLPASDEPLAVLSRRALGDAHALDVSRPLGRLVSMVVRAAFPSSADDNASSRLAWSAAGVMMSGLTSTVLCLGVPGADCAQAGSSRSGAATASVLETMRAVRAPLLLTLDQVRSGGVPVLPPGGVVYVSENPTVVDVIAQRWSEQINTANAVDPAPIVVCTSGQPSTAVVDLLTRLKGPGVEVRYHGDFDWAGLRIARFLSGPVPWVSWRFGTDDYLAAVGGDYPSLRLSGMRADSPWDPLLASAMAEHGLAIEEEAVAGLLADDVVAPRLR
jgi:uncharacterized protein (TIGR02679 family)